jgi:2-oxoglutarate dehydrogenase E2 component (dihydrolipoamide succinyltransferase)
MLVDIKIPSFGESITEVTLGRWLRKEGDVVRQDESILELETDKASQELASPAAGRLHITVKEGTTVPVGAIVGQIDTSVTASTGSNGPAGKPASVEVSKPAAAHPTPAPAPANAGAAVSPAVMPAAQNLATQLGIDPSQVPGTGRGGRVLKEDVKLAAEQQRPVAPTPPNGPTAPAVRPESGERETRKRMSTVRKAIAERLVFSQKSTASLTTFNEADMSAVMALRAKYKDSFKEKHGVGLGFMSFFVKAAIDALKAYPGVNASIDGPDVVYHNFYNISVAVSTEKGLMVPVLRDADRLSFAGVEKGIGDLAVKARDGKIAVSDLQGGTFTITNGGTFGSMMSTPILNPPQSGILGLHAINKRPVVVNDQVVVRPMMYLALTYDHRLVDGREAVLFLVRVKECIESPERLMLEI